VSNPLRIGLLLVVSCFINSHAAEEASVFRSTDEGRSWARSDRGLSRAARVNAFASIGDSVLAGTDSGIFISKDQGLSWRPCGGVAGSSGRVIALAALGNKLFAGTDRSGILESPDQGMIWAANKTFPCKSVRSLLGYDRKLLVGTDDKGMFVSVDHGVSWEQSRAGLPHGAQVLALAVVKGKVFAGLYSQGLYSLDDQTGRWSKIGPVSPLVLAAIGDTLVVGHNPGGIYTSDDLGKTWSKATSSGFANLSLLNPVPGGELSGDAPIWELAASSGSVFAGAGSGIYYSEDKGRSWTRAREGLPEECPGVAFLLSEDLVLAATFKRVADQSEGRASLSR